MALPTKKTSLKTGEAASHTDHRTEALALGAMLLNGHSCYVGLCSLTDDHFTRDTHKALFRILRELYDLNESTDTWRVEHELQMNGLIEFVGGDWLGKLTEQVPTSSQIDQYADHLDNLRHKRTLGSALRIAQAHLDAGEGSEAAKTMVAAGQEFRAKGPRKNQAEQIEDLRLQLQDEIRGKAIGLPMPFKVLAKMLGGWLPGCSYVLAGLTSVGKSHLTYQLILEVAQFLKIEDAGRRIHVWSKEMSHVLVNRKLASLLAGINLNATRMAGMNPDDQAKMAQALEDLKGLPIDIDDTKSNIREMSRLAVKKKGRVALFVVDHMQIVKVPEVHDEFPKLTAVSGAIKQMAIDADAPVIALSQFNRVAANSDGEPQLWHLRGSSAIEDDADGIMILHRANYGKNTTDLSATLRLCKNRPMGTLGTVRLEWSPQGERYREKP